MSRKVCIVGLGFVGEHLLESFYESGKYNVSGYDISDHKFSELTTRFPKATFTTDPDTLTECDLFCIAVPTLLNAAKNGIDTQHILQVKKTLSRIAKPGSSVVVESSVYVGATRELFADFLRNGIHVGFSPERVDPGRVLPKHTDIPKVVSGLNTESLDRINSLYSDVFKCVVPVSSTECAEMCKLYENCFRMINIAYVNEISDLCTKHGIDSYEMINASKTKPFGFMSFTPGLGVGGHCIPVNPYYLAHGDFSDLPVLHRSVQQMEARPTMKANTIVKGFDKQTSLKILVIGMSFKPGETLLTNSPSVTLVKSLLRHKHRVYGYDPMVCDTVCDTGKFPKIDVVRSDKWWDTLFQNTVEMSWLTRSEFHNKYLESFDKIVVASRQHGVDWNVLSDVPDNKIVWFIDRNSVINKVNDQQS